MDNPKMISVSDLNSWLYCPRKLYLQRVCGLQVSPNRNMVIGKIKHNILEEVSKREEKLISQVDENFDGIDLAFLYEDMIRHTAKNVFDQNQPSIERFLIDKEDILKKVLRDFAEDIKLRIASIKETLAKGFTKENLWKNLDSVYLSELKLESEHLGLRGRVDRVIISRKDNTIIPYELKSREERIFHSDEVQLTAYAMLLEYHYKQPITKGVVEVGNNKQELEITAEKKQEVLSLLEQIRKIYSNESIVPPIQSNFNKCRICEFQEECGKI
jgi:CRISPR-associated protein Cas4